MLNQDNILDTVIPYIDMYLKVGVSLWVVNNLRESVEIYTIAAGAILLTLTIGWTVVKLMRDWQEYKTKKRINEGKDS